MSDATQGTEDADGTADDSESALGSTAAQKPDIGDEPDAAAALKAADDPKE